MSARPSRSSSPTTATSPRTPPRWSRSTTTCCRRSPTAARRLRRRTRGAARAQHQYRRQLQGRSTAMPRRPSPRPRMSSMRTSGSTAAPRIRSKAAAFSRNTRADDSITVWASTQKAHDLLQSLTALLDFDESRLRVATPDVGGGFGPKLCVYPGGRRRGGGGEAAPALDQMDRGPPRAFHQRRAGARPVLVDRRSRSTPTASCSASAASCCTTSAPTRCRTSTSRTIRPR